MKALVTGGAGFVGRHLVEALDDVTVVDSLVNAPRPPFDFIESDILDLTADDLTDFDVIFHNAASKSTVSADDPERDLRVNALGTLRLVRAAEEAGVRKFIHASTGSVMGPSLGTWDEDHPTRPLTYYGVSKLAAESYVRRSSLDWTILRYFHVIGPRQDPRAVVTSFVEAAKTGTPITIYGSGEQVRSFTSVHDIVKANLLAVIWPKAVVNIASGIRVSINELAEFIRSEIAPVPVVHFPERPGEVYDFEVDNSLARSLGMEFDTDWRSVVREVIG